MTDADLQRLANLARVIDHLETHGLTRSLAYERMAEERDRLVVAIAGETQHVRHVPAFPDKRKGRA